MRIALAAVLLGAAACGGGGDVEPDAAPDPGDNPQVVAPRGFGPSMAYIAGRPAVAYRDADGAIWFAIAGNEAPLGDDAWSRHLVEAGAGVSGAPSLTEANGRAVIAYAAGNGPEVAVAQVAVPAATDDWAIHTIAVDPLVGPDVSIDYASFNAVGVEHRLAVAYYDRGMGAAKVAYTSKPAPGAMDDWTVVTVDDDGDCGSYLALSVSVRTTFQMGVAYYEADAGDLRFSRALTDNPAAPDDWEMTEVHRGGDAGKWVDIAYAPATGLGQANAQWFMAYYRADTGDVWFATVEVTGDQVLVDGYALDEDGDVGMDAAIALVDGTPVVVYRDAAGGMKIARTDDLDPIAAVGWEIAPIDLPGDVGVDATIAVSPCGPEDVGGLGRVDFAAAYRDDTNDAIAMYYAAEPSGSWFVHRAHPTARTLLYGAAVEVDGQVVAVYGDRAGRTLDVATSLTGAPRSTDDWQVETLATGVDPTHVSMAIVDGAPAFAYLDRVTGALRYGRRTGDGWLVHDVTDRGRHARLAVLGGLPAIAFFDEAAGTLELARADSRAPSGAASWDIHTVATGIAIADGVSLAELDGAPVLHYADNLAGYYAAANGPDPTSPADWTVHAMDIESNTIVTPSQLLIVDGRPAVVHRDLGRVAFTLANTPTPTSAADWTSHLVHASNGSGNELIATVRDGIPIIAHWFGPPSGRSLRFATGRTPTPGEIDDWRQYELVERRLDLPGMIPFGTVGSPTTIVFSSKGCLMTARPR